MKKITIILVVLSMILTLSITSYSVEAANTTNTTNTANTTNAAIKLRINGQIADLKGYAPYKSVSGIMVPLAEASRAVGASAEYIKSTKEVKVKLNNTTLVFQAGRKFVLVNGKSLAMGENAVNIKGKVYVPARFLFEKLGGTVGWDNKTNTVVVNIKLSSGSTTEPDPAATDGIDVSMPASADFKPYTAELTSIPTDILEELKVYKDDKDGLLQHKINGVGINEYMPNAEVLIAIGLEKIERQCVAAKSVLEVENNVDYRTIGNDFIQKYRYYFMPLSNKGDVITDINLILHRYEDVKKYKIVEKAEFLTDPSLLYVNKNGENRLRGRLKFMFEFIDKQYFKDHSLPVYELNKWYQSDLEIRCEIFMSKYQDLWPHAYYTYEDRIYINENKLSYDD